MTDTDTLVEEIRRLCKSTIGRKKGLLMNSYESMEVGIRMYNYDVLSRDGFYSGYWTDQEPKISDGTIVSRIVASEDCQEWESLDDNQLNACLQFLKRYKAPK